MTSIQRTIEVILNIISSYTTTRKPSLLAQNITWFNQSGWVTRLHANGDLDYYLVK
jgi:hypothetical protein